APAAVDGLDTWPAVSAPVDRREDRDTTAGVGVDESRVVPGAVLGLHEAALVWRAGAGDRGRHVQQHLTHLVRPPWTCRAQHVLAVGRLGGPDVVVAVALVEARTFQRADARRGLEHLLVADLAQPVGGQLRD